MTATATYVMVVYFECLRKVVRRAGRVPRVLSIQIVSDGRKTFLERQFHQLF
jgi:hypothetical protein